MLTISFYLDTRRSDADGRHALTLRITHKRRRNYTTIGIALLPEEWDRARQQLTRRHVSHRQINLWLAEIETLARRTLQESILPIAYRLTFDRMCEMIRQRALHRKTSDQNFLKYFREFALTHGKSTAGVYHQTEVKIKKFTRYAEELTFEEITVGWLREFDAWMAKTVPSANARGIHHRNIRATFNAANIDEITEHNPYKRYKIKSQPTASRAMSVERLRRLLFWPVEPYAERYRDFFALSFFLCGMNPVDICKLKEVSDGRVNLRRTKTGQILSVKIEPEAAALIIRHRGKKALIDVADTDKDYKNFLGRCTDALKRIGFMRREGRGGEKIITPVFPEVSCYWARHSWATIADDLGILKEVIKMGLGHSAKGDVTEIYIRRDPKRLDAANRRVIDWVCYGIRDDKVAVKPGTAEFYGYLSEEERLETKLPGPEYFQRNQSSSTIG